MGFPMHHFYIRKRTASIIDKNISNLTVYLFLNRCWFVVLSLFWDFGYGFTTPYVYSFCIKWGFHALGLKKPQETSRQPQKIKTSAGKTITAENALSSKLVCSLPIINKKRKR